MWTSSTIPSVHFGISKRRLYFHIVFMPHALYFLLCTSNVLSMFHFFVFFVNDRTRKQTLLVKLFNFIIGQSKVQSALAENEEQNTLNKVICIKFQNCCFFFFFLRSFLQEVAIKMQTNQLKETCDEVPFFDMVTGRGPSTLPKIPSFTSIF